MSHNNEREYCIPPSSTDEKFSQPNPNFLSTLKEKFLSREHENTAIELDQIVPVNSPGILPSAVYRKFPFNPPENVLPHPRQDSFESLSDARTTSNNEFARLELQKIIQENLLHRNITDFDVTNHSVDQLILILKLIEAIKKSEAKNIRRKNLCTLL